MEEIPQRYTCQGEDISPPLFWQDAPAGTQSFALILHDPDIPDAQNPKRIWVHWVLFNLPAQVDQLSEGIKQLPVGTRQGLNDWKRTGYGGPCPPKGRHRYYFRLYALDTMLDQLQQPTKAVLEKAMEGHILAMAELVGTYQKVS
ncbi:MAG: YbhB/YbcL family Raf kinase inhibitor-like protein [Magnetococcales bacterium]|nr:YbhB/YbcL family Raf kinase inhibitor-like protein [Magnetococcales bacterium]NGZ25313.1 YbhB/YbcL family Raf kinase inhibitor-like protein [Magnetococcales bacterium]